MAGPSSALSHRKLVSLDGIRGVAILAVMLHHSYWTLPWRTPGQAFLNHALYLGWSGVDLFFVLSGFLITGILLDSREAINYFRAFYARRVLRIFPLYYAFLLVAFAGFPFLLYAPEWLPLPGERWVYICYLTNWEVTWHGPWGHNILAHLWSLAVEEQFYFCWPLLVWLVRARILLPSLLAGEVAMIAGRVWWVLGHGASPAVEFATITRMDGLVLGAVCAILVREYRVPERFVRWMPAIAGVGLWLYLRANLTSSAPYRLNQLVGFPVLSVCFALLVLYAVLTEGGSGPLQMLLTRRTLTRVGKYAYGIYVFHQPLFHFANVLIGRFVPPAVVSNAWFGYLRAAILIVASYQIAKFSYNRFERYFLDFKSRFEPVYAPPVSTPV